MIKTKRGKIILTIVFSALAVLLLFLFHKHEIYQNNIYAMLSPRVSYNGESIFTTVSSEYIGRFTNSKKRLYFGKIDEKQRCITITVPDKVTITVYPNDDDSVLMVYDPHHLGFTKRYKLSGYGDFNRHLKLLYQSTGNEVFNETIDLPKAK